MEDSTNTVKIFENEQFGQVRTIEEGDKILFCGSDVAKALGYSNAPDALNRHCRAIVKRDTPISGKIQAISFIPEGDVYRLIARSKLPEAEKFESWVFDEILPTIRKTGGYVANDDQFIATYLPFADESTKMLFRATLEVVNQQNKKIAADAPKVNYYDALIDRGVNLSLRETGKELGLGKKRFIARLLEDNYLYRTSKYTLCAYSKYTESGKGYFTLKECFSRASDWGGVQVLVTPKGRDFFRRKYGTLQ